MEEKKGVIEFRRGIFLWRNKDNEQFLGETELVNLLFFGRKMEREL